MSTSKAGSAALKLLLVDHIAPDAVRPDRWSGYIGLESEFPKLVREKSEKEGKELPPAPQNGDAVQSLGEGVHHSVLHLPSYIDEYTYPASTGIR